MSECDYCGSEKLAYDLESDRGKVTRCIPCLAIEQGQQSLSRPFESFIDFEDSLVHDSVEESKASAKRSYNRSKDWYRILARVQSDDPLIKRDPDAIGTVGESTRTFLTNIMGSDAHYPPSEVAESEVAVAQATLAEAGDSDE